MLADGFAVKRGARVFELDTSGKLRTEHALDVDGDVRVIGSSIGPLAGYQNGNKLDLVRVRDGKTESSWGKSVRKLCDGVATNDANFAIGWLETDNRVWIVYGPTSDQVLASASTARLDWCGVASAGSNIGLFWRERDKLQWQLCSRKGCSGLPSRYDLVKNSPVLGIGCLADGCAIASLDNSGVPQLAYVTTKSKVVWTARLLAYAAMPVSIVGTPNALVVGYANRRRRCGGALRPRRHRDPGVVRRGRAGARVVEGPLAGLDRVRQRRSQRDDHAER